MPDTLHILSRSRFTIFPILLLGFVALAFFSRGAPRGWLTIPAEPHNHLEEEVELSEAVYRETVKERHEYIDRLGGEGAVENFPLGGYDTPWTVWDFLPPTFTCPHRVERIGMLGDGGKWVCGMDVISHKENPVVYSFGVNTESSFEAAILRRAPGAHVYGYDFSVNSFGPEITENLDFNSRAHFFKYAIGGTDAHGPGTNPDFQMYRLDTLMKLNGHDFIDILKIDIEGAEFPVLSALLDKPPAEAAPLPIGQLQVEIHLWNHDIDFPVFLHWFESLEEMGFRPFWNEPNLVYVTFLSAKPYLVEYSFLNIRGQHELISDMRA